jgi:rod shape-determining protein MreD
VLLVPALVVAVLLDSFALALTGPERLFDPYLVLVVLFAAQGGRKTNALIVGALVGLAQDGLGSAVFGVHYLAKLVVAYAACRAGDLLIPGQPLTWAVLLGGGTVLELFVYRALGFLLGQSFDARSLGALVVLLLVNLVLGSLICLSIRLPAGRGARAARARR